MVASLTTEGVKMSRQRAAFPVLVIVGVLAACGHSASRASYVSLSDIDPVRAAFNADSGKVRAIFLASPT